MQKIKDNEIKELAYVMAKCFKDYPLYNVFFKNDDKKIKRIYYFFWYRLYTRKNYSYVTEDKNIVVSFKKPGDKDCSAFKLWLNPSFLFGFIFHIPISALLLVADFGKMEEKYWEKYYNPVTDCYAQAICVMKESRGDGRIFKILDELNDGSPIFGETHTAENVKLYELMGLELCDSTVWHGVNHYVVKKRGHIIKPCFTVKR